MAVEPDKAVDRRGWTEEAELWMRFMRGSGLAGGEAAWAKSIDHEMYKSSCLYGHVYRYEWEIYGIYISYQL